MRDKRSILRHWGPVKTRPSSMAGTLIKAYHMKCVGHQCSEMALFWPARKRARKGMCWLWARDVTRELSLSGPDLRDTATRQT